MSPGREQPRVAVGHGLIDRGLERIDHSINDKPPVAEVIVVRAQHERAPRQLVLNVGALRVQQGSKPGDHRRAVDVQATHAGIEVAADRPDERRDRPRGGAIVDHALMPDSSGSGHER
jgi:hypothetical protein